MYIVLIKEMWESDDGKKEIQGHWIYRSSDMPKSVEMLHKSEVFLSDWVDCNPIESVVQVGCRWSNERLLMAVL